MRSLLIIFTVLISLSCYSQVPTAEELVQIHQVNSSGMNGITSPVTGSLAFNSDDSKLYVYDGSNWIELIVGNVTASGDVTGAIDNNTVEKIQNIDVDSTTPTDGQLLIYNANTTSWEPQDYAYPQLFVDASRTSNYDPANNSFQTLAYNSTNTNVGNAYNTTTGIFTAPEDGLYQVQVHNVYRANQTFDNKVELRILVNGNTDLRLATSLSPYNRDNQVLGTISGTTTVSLAAGQTISIQVGNEKVGNNFSIMVPEVNTGQHRLKIIRLK